MVHICFSLYDPDTTYSKYVGVAVWSILANTKEAVSIHLLHDMTLSEENQQRFRAMVDFWHQSIFFYKVDLSNNILALKSLKNVTRGTLFRLKIADILPINISKVIYLDADILCNIDIFNLWNEPFLGKFILARKDGFIKNNLIDQGILSVEQYINAGVIVFDLKAIRQWHNLYQEAECFFQKYPNCMFADQDALNFIFKGEIGLLDLRYNMFTKYLQGGNHFLEKGIYHFAGDHPCMDGRECYNQLFFGILLKTPWGEGKTFLQYLFLQIREKEKQAYILRSIIANCRGKKIVLFGAYGLMQDRICQYLTLNPAQDYCVDNKKSLQGLESMGLKIYAPDYLLQENKADVYIIVISRNYYADIKQQLEKYGFLELQHFVDGRWLLMENEEGYCVQ